jgi:CheY-like chemotaxis protein
MPEMGGMELLQALKSAGPQSDIRFGFITTEGSPTMRQEAAQAGALFLIAKPFTAEDFVTTLGPLLNGERLPSIPPPVAPELAPAAPRGGASHALAPIDVVRNCFASLTGKGVTAKPDSPLSLTEPKIVASYGLEGVATRGLSALSLPLAANLGAALAMMPQAIAKEAVQSRTLPEALRGNLGEVLNVVSTLFRPERGAHLKLGKVYIPGEVVPKEPLAALTKAKTRLDATVDLAGYGVGKLSLVLYNPTALG